MARRWEMTHEQTEVGFDVLSVQPANKSGYVVTTAKYPTVAHNYQYVRKFNNKPDGTMSTVVDGCEVTFTASMTVVDVTRIYDTKGQRKKT